MDNQAKQPRVMPKGGRKGGTRFPRYSLNDALSWARKLVSKTHLGPQPAEIIFASVVESKSSVGEIKVSSLRQYGLMDGSSKGYFATDLAKAIAASPSEELPDLYERAATAPDIFKALFDTFHGDDVTTARLKQRAADLKVHPDEAATCVELYLSAMTTAGLVSLNGEKVTHRSAHAPVSDVPDLSSKDGDPQGETLDSSEEDEAELQGDSDLHGGAKSSPRAIFNVNVNLDSSLDTDKLERQLRLLKRFGAI